MKSEEVEVDVLLEQKKKHQHQQGGLWHSFSQDSAPTLASPPGQQIATGTSRLPADGNIPRGLDPRSPPRTAPVKIAAWWWGGEFVVDVVVVAVVGSLLSQNSVTILWPEPSTTVAHIMSYFHAAAPSFLPSFFPSFLPGRTAG